MPTLRFQPGETVMGRWPGSNLYYEVKVLSYDPKPQLYTVIYKDGTELDLKDTDIKSLVGFRQSSGRSRSRSRSRSPARTRRSRSRSPARTSRGSSSRTSESRKDKLKEMLEVRLTPIKLSAVHNNNSKHEHKEENGAEDKIQVQKEEKEPENQVGGRYNLRRRKEQVVEQPVEVEQKVEAVPVQAVPLPSSTCTGLEFGGRFGVLVWLLVLPLMVMSLLILCNQKDASLLSFPLTLSAWPALWDGQVFGIVLLWLLFQVLLSLLPFGKVVEGMPLKNGQTLKYRTNGFYALVISGVLLGAAVYNQIKLSYVYTHFLQFFVSALLVSIILSIYLYVRSGKATEDQRSPAGNSGYMFYDFFMGRELNPRIRDFDIKFFCELRPGLIGWVVINLSMLLAEIEVQNRDRPSNAMLLVNAFQLLWVADGLWHEEKLLTMMDITYDGFGFMLAFGDLVWVPFTFTCQSYYLVQHRSDLMESWVIVLVFMNAIGYYIFRKSNSEKFVFRRNPSDPAVSHLKTIPSTAGKSLIVSGLWGFVRHPNYLGDIMMALSWSLTCGFNHVVPYFYPLYLIVLLVHRGARDEWQCRRKYGSAWEEYCRAVPYRILPKVY